MTLRTRFTLIPVITALLVVISMLIASYLLTQEAEERFVDATFHGKTVLWGKILNNQLNELELGVRNLTRDRTSLAALQKGDQDTLNDNVTTTYNRLSAAGMLSKMQISDPGGRILYSSSGTAGNVTRMKIVKASLDNRKIMRGIDRDDNGELAAVVAFPLFARGEYIGAGVFVHHLRKALDDFREHDGAESFIVNQVGEVEGVAMNSEGDSYRITYATDEEMFPRLALPAGKPDEFSTFTRTLGDALYTVSVQSIQDFEGQDIAHLVSANNSTEAITASSRIRNISLLLILGGIAAAGLFVLWYVRRSFGPIDSLMHTVRCLSEGDISARTGLTAGDEVGQLGRSFDQMAQTIQDTLERERSEKDLLDNKIEQLLGVVRQAAEGDLTGQLTDSGGDDTIDQLARNIRRMVMSLNSLIDQVQHSGIQVTSSATEIAATSKQQEATVSEQAASTNQIMATATEISATSRELVNTMDEVSGVAESTAHAATQGQGALTSMEETMRQMKDATDTIAAKLAVMSEKAGNIYSVVTTINKVADQTNLLSLNAAIEAEKAGEYGLGFAVVATEIRRLADQTAVATWDIEQMVKEMQSAVSAGVMGMDKFSEEVSQGVGEINRIGVQLAAIIEQVQALTPRFELVNEGMQSQSQGAQQISEGMVQLNELAQHTAESLHQSNSSIQQLKNAAQGLQKEVSRFKLAS